MTHPYPPRSKESISKCLFTHVGYKDIFVFVSFIVKNFSIYCLKHFFCLEMYCLHNISFAKVFDKQQLQRIGLYVCLK